MPTNEKRKEPTTPRLAGDAVFSWAFHLLGYLGCVWVYVYTYIIYTFVVIQGYIMILIVLFEGVRGARIYVSSGGGAIEGRFRTIPATHDFESRPLLCSSNKHFRVGARPFSSESWHRWNGLPQNYVWDKKTCGIFTFSTFANRPKRKSKSCFSNALF